MDSRYFGHKAERMQLGIPALPLDAAHVKLLADQLCDPPPSAKIDELLELMENRVSPGLNDSAKVKVDFLADIVEGKRQCSVMSKKHAVKLLGTMLGGYNTPPLVKFLDYPEVAQEAVEALSNMVMIFDNFEPVTAKARAGNQAAVSVLKNWAEATWFLARPSIPKTQRIRVCKGPLEVNTDDLSPAGQAPTRPDIPLHALHMCEVKAPKLVQELQQWREDVKDAAIAFVAEDLGGGSSRKSATNSVVWWIGQDLPYTPNKRVGGICIGRMIAPIFFTTFEDAGGLPIRFANSADLKHGEYYVIDFVKQVIVQEKTGKQVGSFKLEPPTISDEVRAGGRLILSIGRSLADRAREFFGQPKITIFEDMPPVIHKPNQKYTLAQKILGKGVGKAGVLPKENVDVHMSTVMSQDTTGPMTVDEMKELACTGFVSDFVFQTFCHTCAYPKPQDLKMHEYMPPFFRDRGGVALTTKDGVCHTWASRFTVPNLAGTGGDSHTRFPMGMAIPAGSGLVAFAAATGFMPLQVPESALVNLTGSLQPGITLRDIVNAIPLVAVAAGIRDQFDEKSGNLKRNALSGTIMEFGGDFCGRVTVEQAFELTNATAERSAACSVFDLDLDQTIRYCKSNVALMQHMLQQDEHKHDLGLKTRIQQVQDWLKEPYLIRADVGAEYAVTLNVDVGAVMEPVLACPSNPENIKVLSEVSGTRIHEVFIGSCMTNIGHFRAAAMILQNSQLNVKSLWLAPPSRMDQVQLEREGVWDVFRKHGDRVHIETPGCSLCMGNQARVSDGSTVFSTSTRNFAGRMGNAKNVRVYLGSAECAAVVAKLGRLPTVAEYMEEYRTHILPNMDKIYHYLNFHEQENIAW